MTPDLPTPDIARLLAEAEWVRRLAAKLVGGAEAGEDLAQDTLVAAIERGGPGEVRNVRAWLTVIARNFALRGRRRERERTGVERRAARTESLESARAAVERMELQRLLADAVLALPEPQRSAVIWRHLDGLSAAEIATRQGISAELARQRVARGLAQLRERLDRSHGSRGAWCTAFVGALRLELAAPATALGAATWGGIAVASKGTWMIVGAAGVAAVAWLVATWASVEPRATAPGPSTTAAALQAPPASARSTESTSDAHPDSVAAQTDPRRALATPAKRILSGEVVSRRGEPVAGADLSFELARSDSGTTRAQTEQRASDAQGRFELELPDGALALLVRHPEYLPARVACDAGDPQRVVLAARPLVTGRLLDAEGAPATGAATVALTVRSEADGSEREVAAQCSAEGTFQSSGLEVGRLIRIRARVSGWERTEQLLDLALEEEGRAAVDVQLSRGYTLTGLVLDAHTRAPIPHATVWAEAFFLMSDSDQPRAVTDADGRFAMSGLTPATRRIGDKQQYLFAHVMLGARAEGYVTSPFRPIAFLMLRPAGDDAVELLLEPALGGVSGRVLLPDGESPAAGETVVMIDAARNLHFDITDSEGRFEIAAVAVGPFAVRVQSGEDVPKAERLAGEARAEFPQQRELELVLAHPSAAIEGRVLDVAGAPAVGVEVEANSRMSTGQMAVPIGDARALTDATGRFRIEHLQAGQCTVTVSRGFEGAATTSRPSAREVVLRADATVADCDFEIAPPMSIAGRVESASGEVAGLEIALVEPATGDERRSIEVDASGAFSFANLFPAACDVVVRRGDRELARVRVGVAGTKDLLFSVSE